MFMVRNEPVAGKGAEDAWGPVKKKTGRRPIQVALRNLAMGGLVTSAFFSAVTTGGRWVSKCAGRQNFLFAPVSVTGFEP